MGIMANTNLTNQRQVFVEEYVRSGDHLEAAKKILFRPIPVIEYFLATLQNIGTEFAECTFITQRL